MSNPDLDIDAVGRYLADRIEGLTLPLSAEKFAVGQSNPTFRLSSGERSWVLRRKPPGVLLKSAHAVDREFRVQRALASSDVPVPAMYHLCEDDSVIGSAFYVMEEIKGRHFDDPRLKGIAIPDRMAFFEEINRVLAAIHSIDLRAVGLQDYGPDGNYYRRQIDRWVKQYRASETEVIAPMEELIKWLDQNIPAEDGQRTLVHGDYRIDNMLFDSDSARCLAVLDWELSTTGHPYADLAAVIMQWQMPPGGEGRGLAGVDRNAEGLISDQAFIDMYCQRRGLAGIDRFGFYLSFAFFRMAAILQGVYKRALDGNASDPGRAKTFGAYVTVFAQNGLKAAE
ncbi:phosphotransferase family protein [Thalassobius sp. Cn5-15]|uniref:phosphotransferase family protein n=1 Tax=Thalassobius sp. Cn5-15 TaxID=2917763 RepID=UPI001EF35B39|nr:phosphotransferase family protein [Thalassobius sp. Cn5-15]MCG7494604.1 phosphotransferase family protein [Thalassobius sp. Cn5-15]